MLQYLYISTSGTNCVYSILLPSIYVVGCVALFRIKSVCVCVCNVVFSAYLSGDDC